MTTTHSYRGIAWLDLESPTEAEISSLVKRYDLHPLVGEELRRSSVLAKIDIYKDYIMVVLTLPVRSRKNGTSEIINREVDFVIGRNFLITSRTEAIEQLEYFSKVFETNSILNKDEKIEHAGYLFYYIVKRIYAGMIEDLENIRDSLTDVEAHIFKGDERDMVVALSNFSRELIDFKQTARMHKNIWDEMANGADQSLFGPDFRAYVRDIGDMFNVIHELITNTREMLGDLRETNDSLLSTKQNRIMQILTVVATIFYPLTFITDMLLIDSPYVPIIGMKYDWWITLAAMGILGIILTWYFKKKRWI